MNALLRKEVRLLLPSFAMALALSCSFWLLPSELGGPSRSKVFCALLSFIACPALVVMMALDSFGKEVSAGTFPMLLAQPIARTQVWRMKTCLLAVATLIVLTLWLLSFHVRFAELIAHSDAANWKWTPHATAVLFALVTFSGGLWTVLFFRQVTAAFWFTLIMPGAILTVLINVVERYPVTGRNLLMLALALYSVAGFFFARRLFLRAQDLQPSGGEIALPRWRARNWHFASMGHKRRWRPHAALWRKELQLHQSQFILAGVLLVLHLSVITARRFVDANKSPSLDFVLLTFWVLWLFLPLLIGCTAIAEERKLGTLEEQLCLPATRWRQFLIKFASTLLLAVVFGAVMPLALERTKISPDVPPPHLAGIAAVIGLMAFYASSLSRNTLQSLAPGVLGVLLMFTAANMAAHRQDLFGISIWPWRLTCLIGVPAFAIALIGLMYWNFKRVLVGGMVWRRNALVLLLTLLAIPTVTATLYHRAWEMIPWTKPAHGSTSLNAGSVKLKSVGPALVAEFLDGRIWAGSQFVLTGSQWNLGLLHGEFLEGTNWAQVEGAGQNFVGVQKDGSLWSLSFAEIISPTNAVNQRWTRVGSDNDWKGIAGNGSQAFLLKADGTLWRWGTNFSGVRPDLSALVPERVGTDSDWAEVSTSSGYRAVLRKADGRVWVAPPLGTVAAGMFLPGTMGIQRVPFLDAYRNHTTVLEEGGPVVVGLGNDGTFRIAAARRVTDPNGRVIFSSDLLNVNIALDTQTNWNAVTANFRHAVTLRGDGTLWKWTFPSFEFPLTAAKSMRLGQHTDWIGIAPAPSGVVSLAADGGLWLWRFEVRNDFSPEASLSPLLTISRRPQLIGNIFSSQKSAAGRSRNTGQF